MPYVLLLEALLTLPALRVFITPPGLAPSVLRVCIALCALAPLLAGLRLLFVKQPSRWWWVVVPLGLGALLPAT